MYKWSSPFDFASCLDRPKRVFETRMSLACLNSETLFLCAMMLPSKYDFCVLRHCKIQCIPASSPPAGMAAGGRVDGPRWRKILPQINSVGRHKGSKHPSFAILCQAVCTAQKGVMPGSTSVLLGHLPCNRSSLCVLFPHIPSLRLHSVQFPCTAFQFRCTSLLFAFFPFSFLFL